MDHPMHTQSEAVNSDRNGFSLIFIKDPKMRVDLTGWIFMDNLMQAQASTLTQNDTGSVGPVTPSIYWS